MTIGSGSGSAYNTTGYYKKTPAKPKPKPRVATSAANAAYRQRLQAANQGAGDVADYNAAVQSGAYQATPLPGGQRGTNTADVRDWRVGTIQQRAAGMGAYPPGAAPALNLGSGGGRGGGGGGGGGGGPAMTQAQLDWLAKMMQSGRPDAVKAAILDLPEFKGKFDPAMYNQLRAGLTSALGQASQVGKKATSDLMNFLNTNYQNAYTNPNNAYATAGEAPGMSQMEMSRMMQGQGGIDPTLAAAEAQGRAGANQAFGNYWRGAAAGEDIAQRQRLAGATQMGGDVANRIEAERIAGTMGIGMQEATARQQFEQQMAERNWQTAQQEAMNNWQRGNTVTDQNAANTNAYNNQVIQAMLGLIPGVGNLNLPNMAALGLG